ncbi:hypothetical protein NGC87_06030 [Staphylococcus pseudoxylosus]|uniref:hypothetical protein n=1 Tax=Staphylococcus pseudoxylosus TaxID=2282419 RepID=UPI002DBA4BB0|nr:hypothetical protein [Staphylococcus pseudoxylosus]MEB7763880.1 hypothetical protein [Staphylococcus pseudoxylosus]
MFKQVFLYDGTPYLAYKNEDGEYQYPNEDFTETAPPEGIYSPFEFDGNEWIGATKEEWEANNPKDGYEPTNNELQIANTQMQVTKIASQLIKSQKEQAGATQELTKKEQRLQEAELEQANAMLEITKLKGSN